MKNEKKVTIKTTNSELFGIAFDKAIIRATTRYMMFHKTKGNIDLEEIIKLHEILGNGEDISTDKIISTLGLIRYLNTEVGKSKCLKEGDSIWYSVRTHDRLVINATVDGKTTQFTYRISFIRLDDVTENITLGDVVSSDSKFINALQLNCLLTFASKRAIIK